MEATKGQLLSLREVAERLGISVDQLRDMCRRGTLPAQKHGGRWLVQAADVPPATALQKAGPRRVRGRIAEGVALDDMTHQLLHRGTAVASPKRSARLSPERAAAAAAIDRQLEPNSADRSSLPLPAGVKGRARQAQRKVLEHMQERMDGPRAPERSI